MLKELVSYIFPITRKVRSSFSGDLEINLINGRKVLDSKSTNYSFGSLQRILKYALEQIDLNTKNEILLLGLGGGSVVETLRNDLIYSGSITAIEIDRAVITIADKEFGITSDEKTHIMCEDAFAYIEQTDKPFDLIIIDLFIDDRMPEQCFTTHFWKKILKSTGKRGNIIFNTLNDRRSDTMAILEKLEQNGMNCRMFRNLESTNDVLICGYA